MLNLLHTSPAALRGTRTFTMRHGKPALDAHRGAAALSEAWKPSFTIFSNMPQALCSVRLAAKALATV